MEKPHPGITLEKWSVIELLLDQALDLPLSQRTAFLLAASEQDEALKTLLIGLWEAGKEADHFLESDFPPQVLQAMDQLTTENAYGPAPLRGMRFSVYEVVEEIGRGGMSIVYMAKRVDGQFNQTVAMKILKRGMDTDLVVRRFLAERQILAGLQHANIARLLDGGSTPDGRPYLIMEYVEGVPITRYCDDAKLGVKARLALFKKVGEAVEFAHRNLIVHRDLKPTNILVTASGEVKLLDFGIAKVLSDQEDQQMQTMAGARVMTPEYAAPEQIFGEMITTATDVYALGVLLHELLCGTLPLRYNERTLRGIERAMQTHEPQLMSVRLDHSEELSEITNHRDATGQQLKHALIGDLDIIVQKALRKEPDRRYHSASALIEEIERFEKGMPVQARPDTFRYRARKFYGRYQAGVIAATIAIILLISSLIGTFWQARVASAERDAAQREAAKSARVTQFLVNVFESIDPEVSQGDTLTAYDILERGAERLETELGEEPELQSEMMNVIGHMYFQLGAHLEARQWFEKSLNLVYEQPVLSDEKVLNGNFNIATATHAMGRYSEAESLLVTSMNKPFKDPAFASNKTYLDAKELLGFVLLDTGKYEEGKAIFQELLALKRGLPGTEESEIAYLNYHMGTALEKLSEYDKAEEYLGKAITYYRKNLESNGKLLSLALYTLSIAQRNMGRYEDAAESGKELLELREKLYGKEHTSYLEGMNMLGNILTMTGSYKEAEQVYLEAYRLQSKLLGERHTGTLSLMANLGANYRRMGDYDQAILYLQKAQRMLQEELGSNHPRSSISMTNLGVALEGKGDYKKAESLHRRALDLAINGYGEKHLGVGVCGSNLASVLFKQGRLNEALELINKSVEIFQERVEPQSQYLLSALTIKGQVLFALNQRAEARQILEMTLESYRETSLPVDHILWSHPMIVLGKLHLLQGEMALAKQLLETSLEIRLKHSFNETDWRLGEAEAALGMFYLETGETTRATTLIDSALKRLRGSLGEKDRLTIEVRNALARLESN